MVADSAAPPALKGIPDLGPQASIVTNVTNQLVIDSSAISGIASGDSVNVEHLSAYNNHATVATTVEFNVTDGTVRVVLSKVNLLPGETLLLTQAGMWLHYDSNGALYPSVGNKASQAEMEGAAADDKYTTPAVQHFHPGHPKCWGKVTVSGGTPTLQTSYNMTSITDTATDQLTITVANDFSTANWALIPAIEAATTTLSATTTSLLIFIRNATQAAGSAILQACEIDIGAATDPAAWHWVGLGDQA